MAAPLIASDVLVNVTTASDTDTTAFTVASNDKRVLVVYLLNDSSVQADGVTYNGVSLTRADFIDSGDETVEMWYLVDPATGSNDVVVDLPSSVRFSYSIIDIYGADTSDPIDSTGKASGTSQFPSTAITTITDDTLITDGICLGARSITADGTQTELWNSEAQPFFNQGGSYKTFASAGATAMDWDFDSASTDYAHLVVAIAANPADIEQEGFAFGDDDGNEASHTLETQDTNITKPLGAKTIRLLANATGDPPSTAYKLKYQKDGSGGYVDVPTSSSSGGDDLVVDGGDTTQDGSNSTSTTLGITLPAYVAGDLIIVAIDLWQNNNADTDVTWPTGPQGETITSIETGYGGSGDADLPLIALGWFIATGTDAGGNWNVTTDDGTRFASAVIKIPAGEFDPDDPIGATTKANSGTSDVADIDMPAFSAGASDGGGKLIVFGASDQDTWNSTLPSGYTELEKLDQGRCAMQLNARDSAVTDSESISAATFDLNGSNTDALAIYGFIIRTKPSANNEVYISASGNVAAGGEATTARLTAPATKTTGDFDTGRRWDDENGADSIDITEDDYTELEWVITTQSPAAVDDYFEFRLYDGDTAITTYTVTPKWTIGTDVSEVTIQKSLKYTVITTPSALTKSLKYTVLATPSAKTKSLKYVVIATPSAKTKSLKYTVITTPATITKGLTYSVLKAISITKSLHYEVKAAVEITKSLKYTVIATPAAKTKSLKYTILTTPATLTKSLEYRVDISPAPVTKSLKYTVLKAISITKSLKYTVLKATSITKSLKYTIITTPSTITKSLHYEVLTSPSITKSLKYIVKAPVEITKSLKYTIITTPTTITKSLEYRVDISPAAITKSLTYSVLTTPSAITKSLHYEVIAPVSITKNLKYTVISTPAEVTKSLKYTVITTPTTITKSLEYRVDISPAAITKSLHYEVLVAISITKSLKYTVISTPSALTKSLKYVVITTPTAITKSLEYRVDISPAPITKTLIYKILKAISITKSLHYEVKSAVSITKSLKYTISTTSEITKSLKYTILTTPSTITKSLKYTIIATPSAITKSLKYTVLTDTTINKSLTYAVIVSDTITKSLHYEVKAAVSITKSLKYVILGIATFVITKLLKYTVLKEVSITKSLKYTILVPTAITKSLTYDVLTTPTAVSKSIKYTVITSTKVQKTLRYAIPGEKVTYYKFGLEKNYNVKAVASGIEAEIVVSSIHGKLVSDRIITIEATPIRGKVQYE